jgi:hypothetical protein
MVDTLSLVFTILVPSIGALAWLFRLEGKVNTHEKVIEDVKDNHEKAISDVKADVRYIRERIDRAIDGN